MGSILHLREPCLLEAHASSHSKTTQTIFVYLIFKNLIYVQVVKIMSKPLFYEDLTRYVLSKTVKGWGTIIRQSLSYFE